MGSGGHNWVEPVATSKHMDYPYSHIKGNSVLIQKACWASIITLLNVYYACDKYQTCYCIDCRGRL